MKRTTTAQFNHEFQTGRAFAISGSTNEGSVRSSSVDARPQTFGPTGECAKPCRRHALSSIIFSTAMLLGANALGQVLQPPGTFQGHHRHGGVTEEQTPPPANQSPIQTTTPPPASGQPQQLVATAPTMGPGLPPSVLDQPAQPAKVDLAAGKLTIQADNSSLTAILNQVSTSAGMTIDGLNKDVRVFGTYGPGDPREILSSLLDGTGYNVLMFGKTTTGTPSQLTLSPRGAAIPVGQANGMRNAVRENQEEEDEEPTATQYQDAPAAPQPGQVAPPPNPNGGVRSPQQMLQELQQMHQQQQQQQQLPQ